jgi:hypothetical protein
MSLWLLGLVIAGAGAVGGLFNALLTDNGFVLPKYVDADPARIWKPGFLGNLIIGAAAAFVTWGLYGRWAGAVIGGASPGSTPAKFYETLAGFTGAFLAGVGGARILTSEVDKQILRVTASKAAASPPDVAGATAVAIAAPAEALRVVQGAS